MRLFCDPEIASRYKSRAQIARVVTEAWAAANLYCASCSSDQLSRTVANTRACDFSCPDCSERYELKSMRRWNDYRIMDSAYGAMLRAIRSDTTPNLLLLHRSDSWCIERLLLIPRFFFSESIIEKRRPLASTAQRAGWVGCNILIGEVPPDGRIALVENRRPASPQRVRAQYRKLADLENLPVSRRGWTLDVLRCVRRLPREFTLQDVYGFEDELSRLHPDNRHVRDKIRQQLQILRDVGLLYFVAPGRYRASGPLD